MLLDERCIVLQSRNGSSNRVFVQRVVVHDATTESSYVHFTHDVIALRVGNEQVGGVGANVDCGNRLCGGLNVRTATEAQFFGNPITNGVVSTCKPPTKMCVQTLHADTCAGHSAKWTWASVVCRNERITFGRVTIVRSCNECCIELGFNLVDGTRCFKTTNQYVFARTTQPIQRWHWRSVRQQRLIAQYNRIAV